MGDKYCAQYPACNNKARDVKLQDLNDLDEGNGLAFTGTISFVEDVCSSHLIAPIFSLKNLM